MAYASFQYINNICPIPEEGEYQLNVLVQSCVCKVLPQNTLNVAFSLLTSSLLLSCTWSRGSSLSSSFQQSWFRRQKLPSTTQATAIEILLSSCFRVYACEFLASQKPILLLLYLYPPANKALLGASSYESLAASGNGFWSQEARGYALSPTKYSLMSVSTEKGP